MVDRGLIVDVGMCDGADTAFYLAKGFRVIAVEANPALVKRAAERFVTQVDNGSLKIVSNAIGKVGGRTRFFVHRTKDDWSTLREGQWSTDEADLIEVDCVTLDSILRQHGIPYYLKIDIEGSDEHAISALWNVSDLPFYVSAEAQTPAIIQQLYELGYRAFKLVDQSPAQRSALPWIPKEGRYVQMTFGGYHSGPFGEETPGEWKTREEVLAEYRRELAKKEPSWYDFHAKLPTADALPWYGARNVRAFTSLPGTAANHCIHFFQKAWGRSQIAFRLGLSRVLRRILSPSRLEYLKTILKR
jgi:FkbM family methyltransferase